MKKLFFSLALLSSAAVFASEGASATGSIKATSKGIDMTATGPDATTVSGSVSATGSEGHIAGKNLNIDAAATEPAPVVEEEVTTTKEVTIDTITTVDKEVVVDGNKVVTKSFTQKTKDFVNGNKVALGTAAAVAVVATAIYLYNQHAQEVDSFETPAF